jgi:hypothetical protein
MSIKEMELHAPITQSTEAVKALLKFCGRGADPLPDFLEMGQDGHKLVLVLNNKKDAYYTVTGSACSCPANTFHPGQRCKHQRKYFPAERQPVPGLDLAAAKSQPFRPFLEDARPALKADHLLIDLHDTTPAEAAYHEMKDARELMGGMI